MRRKPPDSMTANFRKSFANQSPKFNITTIALLAGVLILGVGIGIALNSNTTFSPSNVASREYIDTKAPNPEICVQYGASAVVMDTRVFLTFNPFNVYVSQSTMRPGCVLRTNNWQILENKNLVTSTQVRDCKNRLNTFGFTGSLDSKDVNISCIYQNDAAKNLFSTPEGAVTPPTETERF